MTGETLDQVKDGPRLGLIHHVDSQGGLETVGWLNEGRVPKGSELDVPGIHTYVAERRLSTKGLERVVLVVNTQGAQAELAIDTESAHLSDGSADTELIEGATKVVMAEEHVASAALDEEASRIPQDIAEQVGFKKDKLGKRVMQFIPTKIGSDGQVKWDHNNPVGAW